MMAVENIYHYYILTIFYDDTVAFTAQTAVSEKTRMKPIVLERKTDELNNY